jgi:hypothetical protein
VVFYRGPEKKTVTMELSKRPVPDITWNPAELAERLRLKYFDNISLLEACFNGFSEAEAECEPAPGEWSAKQTLAHLIQSERGQISNLDDAVGGYERLSDDWGGNLPGHINATIAAYGSFRNMLDELKRLSVELVAFTASLPQSFVERKASYFQYAVQLLELESHTISHKDQIMAALMAAKKSQG